MRAPAPVNLAFFHLRQRSLMRGNLLVLASLIAAIPLSHFPRPQPAPLLAVPTLVALAGTVETVRCIQRRWSLYHGAVLLCIYMDLMALALLFFLLLYPYMPSMALGVS